MEDPHSIIPAAPGEYGLADVVRYSSDQPEAPTVYDVRVRHRRMAIALRKPHLGVLHPRARAI